MPTKRDHKAEHSRRRQRAARRLSLFADIRMQAELLFESNSADDQQRRVTKLMMNIAEYMHDRVNTARREELVDVLSGASVVDAPQIELVDARTIFVNGTFDLRELSRGMVWGKNQTVTIDGEGNVV